MSSNGSDSCSNDSISIQRDAIARQLVAAVTQCQDAPAVARQQADAQAEVESLEALLDPFVRVVECWREELKLDYDDARIYGEYTYRNLEAELEQLIEYGAALAKETGNRALAKATRQVRGALVAIDHAIQSGHEYLEQRTSCGEQLRKENREMNETEKDLLNRLLKQHKQAARAVSPLLPKAKDRLRQLCTQARFRLDRAQARATEIDVWKQRQTELQAAAHALAAIHRVPDAQQDEGGNGR